jgi:hypothetical protein
MPTMLGTALDYRAVPLAEAVAEMRSRGIASDAQEMLGLENFLLSFHKKLRDN